MSPLAPQGFTKYSLVCAVFLLHAKIFCEMADEGKQFWQQLQGESDAAHEVFRAYMGSRNISMLEAWRVVCRRKGNPEPPTTPGHVTRWSNRHRWTERRDAYYAWIDQREREGLAEGARKNGARIGKRVADLRSDYLDLGEKMRAKIERMLDFPLQQAVERRVVEVKDKDGNVIQSVPQEIIVKPARWNMTSIASLANAIGNILDMADREYSPETVDEDAAQVEAMEQLVKMIERQRKHRETVQ